MPAVKLTNALLSAKVATRTRRFDTIVNGLYADAKPTGSVTFHFKFWDKAANKQRTLQVGVFDPARFDVDAARKRARILDGERLQGADIKGRAEQAVAIASKGSRTFNDVADEWIKDMLTIKVKTKHGIVPQCESYYQHVTNLSRARAAWGKWRICDVTEDHIAVLLNGIKKEIGRDGTAKLGAYRNVRKTLTVFFKWCAEPGNKFVPFNLTANLGKGVPRNEKDRVLTDDEIRTLWHGLDTHTGLPCGRHGALAIKLILATGLRPSEVGLSRRNEIHDLDGDNPELHVSASRVKLRRNIYQPLNSLAVDIVREALADGETDGPLFYGNRCGIFDARELGGYLRDYPIRGRVRPGIITLLGLRELIPAGAAPFTLHDLRRTAAHLLKINGIPDGRIAQMLDHQRKPGEGATRSTLTYTPVETNERRATLEALDGILRKIIGKPAKGANVVKLKAA